jgi:MFS transporter, SP family, solute carrier family 2 (myo-inositol transporter), member 13
MVSTAATKSVSYNRFLITIASIGGLLYGIDVGIIAAALLYLGKTVNLTVTQTSMIVAAVLGGSMVSSLVAGFLADWIGRKKMMVVSGLLFVISAVLIVISQGFVPLLMGRLLQGISGGVIAVVVPLYLAECLSAQTRGKGSAIFQFMLTFGIVMAALTGTYYTIHAEAAITAAHGDAALIRAAQDHAWRGMFLSVIYPGFVFFVGTFFLSETPRWLFLRGQHAKALEVMRRSSTEAEAQLQMCEMESLAASNKTMADSRITGSLLRRKYVVPFVLACVILACNQTTGINSILAYLVVILRQTGMSSSHATQGDLAVKLLNCVMTIVAIVLIDRRGRKFLLTLGTAGIIAALSTTAILFHSFESKRISVVQQIESARDGRSLTFPISQFPGTNATGGNAMSLNVIYSYGDGDKLTSVITSDADPVLRIQPATQTSASAPLVIKRASYGPVPTKKAGLFIAASIALFIASFSIGPGVVVWLTLSELMPTRIRSAGMGVALLINQGVSTVIAGVFLPVVGRYGYYSMFGFWAACTVIYFITAAWFLPETKGKTLEEIEQHFEMAK